MLAEHAGGVTAVIRVDVQIGADRVPVLEVRLPCGAPLGYLRLEVARHFRVPAEFLELVRTVMTCFDFLEQSMVFVYLAAHSAFGGKYMCVCLCVPFEPFALFCLLIFVAAGGAESRVAGNCCSTPGCIAAARCYVVCAGAVLSDLIRLDEWQR